MPPQKSLDTHARREKQTRRPMIMFYRLKKNIRYHHPQVVEGIATTRKQLKAHSYFQRSDRALNIPRMVNNSSQNKHTVNHVCIQIICFISIKHVSQPKEFQGKSSENSQQNEFAQLSKLEEASKQCSQPKVNLIIIK